jgi:hypothetical protein
MMKPKILYGDAPGHESACVLSAEHQHRISAAIAAAAPNWLAELHYDESGKPAIIIMDNDLEDDIAPTLIVQSDQIMFSLGELCGCMYRELGEYEMWADLLRAVRIRLLWEKQASGILH